MSACTGFRTWMQTASETAVKSWIWKSLIVLFTFLLLFGSPLQFWLVPATSDPAFDVVYMIGFVIFLIDIVLNSYADSEYFICDLCHPKLGRQQHSQQQERAALALSTTQQSVLPTSLSTSSSPRMEYHPARWTCGLGSFNFWCDLISSAAFLYDISFINRDEFETKTTTIYLDQIGVPTNFERTVNEALPVESDINYIVLIVKMARVARLVPSTKVVAISTRINLYWFLERLTPTFYWRLYRDRRERKRRIKEDTEAKRGSNLVRKASWGGLEIAALAAVKQMAEEEEKKKTMGTRYILYKLKKWSRHALRFLHILPNTNLELNRQIAATKIQRAWRSRHENPAQARSDDGMPDSIDGSLTAGSLRDSGASLRKRSAAALRNQYWTGRTATSVNGPAIGSGRTMTTNRAPSNKNLKSKRQKMQEDHYHGDSYRRKGPRARSQVGTAMAEVTGQRVGVFILLSLLFTLLFSYNEADSTLPSTMVVLHGQTIRKTNNIQARKAVETARSSSMQSIYAFASQSTFYNTSLSLTFNVSDIDIDALRDREKTNIVVSNSFGKVEGYFVIRQEQVENAKIEILATVFVLLLWFCGVAAFAGPIMTFVIIPIERMVRLLGMLMMDPLGYQGNLRFKMFLLEEDTIVKQSQWTREILKGMETSFLMSTILRIGSLMKVGFGSAGVEIIRNNLQKGQSKNMLILNSQGTTVSCIFLFCDIRQFTDATECLQEEVFVFTNRIAEVVHSFTHSYGGSANKNVGDAFLVSWLLEDESHGVANFNSQNTQTFVAKHHQADKALLSVVKICIALHHDEYYVKTMSNHPRTALLKKLENRPGPIVQMGFGLHAGKAVQGAIGSQRKIDATYVSEAVERAEYLETATKKYKLQMLMSDSFHRLLHPSNRRRCRKIDRIMFHNEEDEHQYEEETWAQGDVIELFTYDLDVDALWEDAKKTADGENSVGESEDSSAVLSSSRKTFSSPPTSRGMKSSRLLNNSRRISKRSFETKVLSDDRARSGSITAGQNEGSQVPSAFAAAANVAESSARGGNDDGENEDEKNSFAEAVDDKEPNGVPKLVLPTGPALYSANIWLQNDMRRIRRRYSPVVFLTYSMGLQKYYNRDWDGARQCFEAILDRFDDGPSNYFLNEMKKHDWVPPLHFQQYGRA